MEWCVIRGACLHGAVQAHWGLESQQEVRSQLREGNARPRPQEEIDPNTPGWYQSIKERRLTPATTSAVAS